MNESNPTLIRLYGAQWCPDCRRAKQFFGEQRIQYQYIDIEKEPTAMLLVEQINQGKRIIPTIIFPDGSLLVEPSNAQLAAKLGLKTQASRDFYDTVVVGSGRRG
jgi:thioredoxin reductase (NADPH)